MFAGLRKTGSALLLVVLLVGIFTITTPVAAAEVSSPEKIKVIEMKQLHSGELLEVCYISCLFCGERYTKTQPEM